MLIRRDPVDAQPDRRAAREQLGDWGDARTESAVRARAVSDRGAGGRELRDIARRQVNAVRKPDVVAEPAHLLDVVDRTAAELLLAELVLVDGLGEVGMHPHA